MIRLGGDEQIFPRIKAQQGAFTVFKHTGDNGRSFVPMEVNKKLRRQLERLRIPHYRASQVREWLNTMGICNNSLFPNLDEISMALKIKYFR